MSEKHVYREAWLRAALYPCDRHFKWAEIDLPDLDKIRVSCGWPSAGGTRKNKRVVGQCWAAENSEDGCVQIFISPYLEEPVEVLGTLVHELIHAALPEAKHGAEFKKAAKKLGLEGPATATTVGPKLATDLQKAAEALGPYPNARLDTKARALDEPKPQKNRQRKLFCPKWEEEHLQEGEYILRGSKKTLDLGVPHCPLCNTEMILEVKEDEEEE